MKAIIINGPNLGMLGKRNHKIYGNKKLKDINNEIANSFADVVFDFYQSNHEGQIIDLLENLDGYDFVLINPGGLCHYSVALRDAFEIVDIIKGVCHLSDISTREDFRQVDLLKPLADVYVKGLKENSYIQAIKGLVKLYKKENQND